MKRSLSLLVALLVLLPLTAMAAPLLTGGTGKVVGRYIVVLKAGQEPTAVARAHAAAPEHVYRHALRGFSATLPDAALQRLLDDPRVDYIETDGLVWAIGSGAAAKPGGGGSGGAIQPQVTPWGVTRVGGPFDGSGKTAWVIDTGIDLAHADLNVDAGRSVSFVTRGRITPNDGNGHGTHVAGTIAAKNNNRDAVGVAAGATLVAVRVLDNSGSGLYSWVIAGVDYVAAHAAAGDVANMSLGGGGSTTLDQALLAAAGQGILFAVAAGNDSASAGNYSPARVNHANIFTVSAIDSGDNFARFSNYGNPPVDVAAPGVNILSTARGGGTTTMSGTSMAAPHVAGLLLPGLPLHTSGMASNDPDGTPDPIAYGY